MSAFNEVEIRTPGLVATSPCCGGVCDPLVREYTDERRVWWTVCAYCGVNYRIDDLRLRWLCRDETSGRWRPGVPPDADFLDRVLGRESP